MIIDARWLAMWLEHDKFSRVIDAYRGPDKHGYANMGWFAITVIVNPKGWEL